MLGPQGKRGEVLAELHTDFPQRFAERRQLSALAVDGSRRELQLQQYWFHKGRIVLKFAGVESIGDAETLAGRELQVPREERSELEAGAAYVSEIVGCEVWLTGGDVPQLLGTVTEVRFGAGEAPLLVVREAGAPPFSQSEKVGWQEILLPYAQEFVKAADFAQRRIEVQLPEGLLELEVPLSAEEKQQQKLEGNEARAAGAGRRRRKSSRRRE